MYTKYPNYRFGSRVKLPENYSGSAFMMGGVHKSDSTDDEQDTEVSDQKRLAVCEGCDGNERKNEREEMSSVNEQKREIESALVKKQAKKPLLPSFGLDALGLFSHGFGFEELLLVALIILISQGEGDDELILLLALLLFVR